MDEKINEAAAQNLTLQDQIDDLQSKLDMLANAQRSSAPKPAAPVGADYVGGDEVVLMVACSGLCS